MGAVKYLAETGILAIALMFMGWIFVFKNSRVLARQSEINTLASSIEKTLQEIADENYKFWKDADSEDEHHLIKSRLFSSYIEYRCNIVEKKTSLLFGKCEDCINPAVARSRFLETSVQLVADIRDRATINSENLSLVKNKYGRINAINHLTMKLYSEVGTLVRLRYQPMSEWTWPDNY